MNYKLMSATLMGLVLVGTSVVRLAVAQSPQVSGIPASVQSCFASSQVKQIELLATATEGSTTYYRLLATDSLGQYSLPFVAVNTDNTCRSLITMDQSLKEFASLQKYVSLETARSLALQEVDRLIKELGGKQQYQQALANSDEGPGETVYFAPEEVWALEQRGIVIPIEYILVDPKQPITFNE